MSIEHLDVVIVGAGLSGIGAAYRLQTELPGKSYAILEARSNSGGTWDLFKYPGIRSDSDMFTLGYPFRPWTDAKAIADGPSILRYVRDTARENGIDQKIRYNQKVVAASWSSETATWTATISSGDRIHVLTCNFLYLCSGYYSYDSGYTPDFPGLETFGGTVVHPQFWPKDLDYADKKVVVIGSGATAVTLVPTMSRTAEHVTMLQRSPSYILSLPSSDKIADSVRKILPAKLAHSIVRWKSVLINLGFYQLCRRSPARAKKILSLAAKRQLPQDVPLDPHFTPTYDPWDQRLCVVPDGDLFKALRSGKASIATDTIDTFTETGIRLASGTELEADIIVTATGLKMEACGGMTIEVDGEAVTLGERYVYKGMMISGVPNFALCVGYTNASWTLRADLTSMYVCRLLSEMKKRDHTTCIPQVNEEMDQRPILDLASGYVMRAVDQFPKQGSQSPWNMRQNYILDRLHSTLGDLGDHMEFSGPASPALTAVTEPFGRVTG
ncbi:NAD(P)/FAD-dependent oxidoreductase [Rhodococcus sp. ARC_M6]|uniref:flavin-containing monooxygenase n=1 Tax=Rhodococcus sp. ARC_M6 TaxID=2928852 RepID=UPI001FB3D98C|nr:NAD(P)/FAD-dependent oxidoreductase [Rhodococcus sp. ARC_M6]MCJ0901960.1 NAD(P)/FAD-dependent oxidoreductase [Rhodococcus sp. ARC_M6]